MNQSVPSTREKNEPSIYLNDQESRNLIQRVQQDNSVTLSTAIVQVWFSKKPNHSEWNKAHAGVICFVKDYTKRSYFFRLFNLTFKQLWEQEMYKPFEYKQLSENFHCFAADDCNVGLNFAYQNEADTFSALVLKKSARTLKKKNKPTLNKIEVSLAAQPNLQPIIVNNPIPASHANQTNENRRNSSSFFNWTGKNWNSGGGKKKNSRFDKSQISTPTGFHHVQHVGLTAEDTSLRRNKFDINLAGLEDESTAQMVEILKTLNLPVTRRAKQIVDQFINENGGYERFSEELKHQKPAAPPVTPKATQENFHSTSSPPNRKAPQPPEKQQTKPTVAATNLPSVAPVSPHSVGVVPPPIPSTPSVPPLSASVPPPPPPPPSLLSLSPPAPPLANIAKSIEEGKNQLKSAPPLPKTPDQRTELLNAITAFSGFKRSSIDPTSKQSEPVKHSHNDDSMLNQLEKRLNAMREFLSESDGDDDENDEWE